MDGNFGFDKNNLSMIQVVEVQANEEMATSVDLEVYTRKILQNHQDKILIELDLPTSSSSSNKEEQERCTQHVITSEELNNYTKQLVENHERYLLDLASSSSEEEEFGDENEQAIYETVTNLVEHVALKIKEGHVIGEYRRYICYWCDRRFDNLSSLKAHVPAHLPQARAQCEVCPKSFTSKSSLRDHMRIHTGERPYVCDQCGRSFITSGKLGKHLRWHNKEYRHACEICRKVFLEAYTLRVHKKVHEKKEKEAALAAPTPKTPKMWKCKKCDAGFTRRDDLRQHNKDVHTRHKSSPNNPAAKRQRTPSKSKQLPSVSPTSEGLFECNSCVRKFFTHESLLVHIRRHEKNEIQQKQCTLSCKLCGTVFEDKSLLQQHLEEAHNALSTSLSVPPLKHKCSECHQSFISGSALKKHVLMHSTERPFNCDQCEGTYKTKDDLKRHKRTHMVDRPFKCPQCGHGFVDNTGLIRHVRIHTGERPFVCPDCLKAFTQSSSLKSHRAKKHPNSTIVLTNLRGGAAQAVDSANQGGNSVLTPTIIAIETKTQTVIENENSCIEDEDDETTDCDESTVVNTELNVDNDADNDDEDESNNGAESNFTSVQGLLEWLGQQHNVNIQVAGTNDD